MSYPGGIETYGFEPGRLLTSAEEVWARVHGILSDKVLRFNPYTVDDETLLACVGRASWQPLPALTQMVLFRFIDIREVKWRCPYEAIFFHIGDNERENHLPLINLTSRITYNATKRQIHVMVNGSPLTNRNAVESLCGKDFFVSHAIMGCKLGGAQIPAYRMFRLKGTAQQQASIIRTRMIESKISMLNEVLAHPYCADYLQCSRGFVDYTSAIQTALDQIRSYPTFQTQ